MFTASPRENVMIRNFILRLFKRRFDGGGDIAIKYLRQTFERPRAAGKVARDGRKTILKRRD